MKGLIKRAGILLVVVGVVLLAYSEFSKLENNHLLVWSGGFIVVGLIAYIVLNSIFE